MNVEALHNWNNVLQYGLNCDLVCGASDATHILKLLSFSVYLYAFSTPRLLKLDDDEEQMWKTIFDQFATYLEEPHMLECNIERKICRRRKPTSTSATICLEMIRFEEILARIMRHHAEDPSREPLKNYSTFRYTPGRTVDATLILDWGRGPPMLPCSVFSVRLIKALKVLAGPSGSWITSTQEQLMSRPENDRQTIKLQDVCITYEERIEWLVNTQHRDALTWLRSHCGCQTVPEEQRARGCLQKVWRICSSWGNTSHSDEATSGHSDV